MPRAHLSKRLDDATAIQLFAEHHIVHVRRRKNGEIVAVKHSTFGWMTPQAYYGLQKAHDLLPLLQEFIRGGYQAKAWLWSISVEVLGISVPVGASLPVVEAFNFYKELTRTKTETYTVHVPRGYLWDPNTKQLVAGDPNLRLYAGDFDVETTREVTDIHPPELLLRAYALFGPWGDIIQIIDSMGAAGTLAQGYNAHPLGLLYWGPILSWFFGPPPV